MDQKKIVAAFDFDGTLTYCDSLLLFLFHVVGFWRGIIYLVILIPSFLSYLRGGSSRRELKEKIITKTLCGMPIEVLEEQGKEYASGFFLKAILRTSTIERLQWHQSQGHCCLLISANLELYLAPWAKKLGFSDCLATRLEVDSYGFITGKLQGENCRGKEKTRRLEELLGQKSSYTLYAYGDSDGDRELLTYADHPFWVGTVQNFRSSDRRF